MFTILFFIISDNIYEDFINCSKAFINVNPSTYINATKFYNLINQKTEE